MEELKVLKRLDHPNVIWLHEIIDDESKDFICLVTTWHTRGNLEHMVKKKNEKCKGIFRIGLQQATVRLYFIDMLKALYYCHTVAKVIHRDIKPANIVINHNNEAVLIDFGVSAIIEN